MKCLFAAVFAVLMGVNVFAQVGKIETSNPAPRVGDRISITFSLAKSAAKNITTNSTPLAVTSVGDGTLELNELVLTDTGSVSLGPVQVAINGVTYTTNTIRVHVSKKLPDDALRGVWVRTLAFEGEQYIILEQRHPGELKPTGGSSGVTTFSMSTEDVNWTKLNIEKLQRRGINVQLKSSRASVQSTETGDALYMITVYTWRAQPDTKSELTIEKNLFTDFPDRGIFEVTRQ